MRASIALAHPNIAFIKYWGNTDSSLNLPASGSISMNLAGLETRTRVAFEPELESDRLLLNSALAPEPARRRASNFLDHVRRLAGIDHCALVESENNFPAGAGIASSASAFAALALAASTAAGLDLTERNLSRLARLGSGSACRSVPAGFVEWNNRETDEDSYAVSLAPPDHWELVDCIAIISEGHKRTGSSEGHDLASTSPLQLARLAGAETRLKSCRDAILDRDFDALAQVAEYDTNLMHAVMMTSSPALFYWSPATVALIHSVREWRASGLPVFYTIDAGPNVHVFTLPETATQVSRLLSQVPQVLRILRASPGGPARLLPS